MTAIIRDFWTLGILNYSFQIYGVLLIVFGGLGWDAMPRNYSIGCICLGVIIFLIAVFGCFAALRESSRSLWTVWSFLNFWTQETLIPSAFVLLSVCRCNVIVACANRGLYLLQHTERFQEVCSSTGGRDLGERTTSSRIYGQYAADCK